MNQQMQQDAAWQEEMDHMEARWQAECECLERDLGDVVESLEMALRREAALKRALIRAHLRLNGSSWFTAPLDALRCRYYQRLLSPLKGGQR